MRLSARHLQSCAAIFNANAIVSIAPMTVGHIYQYFDDVLASVQTTGGATACFEISPTSQHSLPHCSKTVGVPAQLRIATVGVDEPNRLACGGGWLMMKSDTSVAWLSAFSLISFQVNCSRKPPDRCSIVITVMLVSSCGFQFDKQRAGNRFMFAARHHRRRPSCSAQQSVFNGVS